ncbi:lycopene beta-cyclase CrtY [Sphingorhabdus sp. Alg239-R122]|uniref:lycopene beta-cyclase CrtY n=1 Tax=Sphingorhabdus sp. Alg239-R122 TaxID=2305989 RepID=UPI0013DA1474|nr:lycopene beta-cyclase CrtY [Sphingorhabdus sp. Alg239-R122]
MDAQQCDVAILGGGLSGCLAALALYHKRSDLDVRIVEAGLKFGGNHIWSFFDSDIADENRWLIEPLIHHSWDGYDVIFPEYLRTLDARYNSITSQRLDAVMRKRLPQPALLTGCTIASATSSQVTLENGETIAAKGVIDTRGNGNLDTLDCGWQKFMGQQLRLAKPHGLKRPVVMDAAVEQVDGYRFVYCLPFGPNDVFIEDTYYSETPDLDTQMLATRISAYAAGRGWDVVSVERSETGVLPVVTGGNFEKYWASSGPDMAKAGARAGLFHPLTSYSLPDAVRFAAYIADQDDVSGKALAAVSHDYAKRQWKRAGYYRLLTKMLFHAAEPERRYIILQRFYTLPEKLIKRFYAGRSSMLDRLRVLAGKPPVRISRAIAALLKR